ncbi:helix-turn-helix transcriptional regulator [Staphylococcus chromogenes]|nr:helix-turn-helix transcriptional regulator [Staphylococcus chromogenes]
MDSKKWLDNIIGEDSYRTVCAKIGVSPSTISQQLKRGSLSPEITVLVARAYEVSPVDALVAIGLLKKSDLTVMGVDIALGRATNRQLLSEIDSRIDPDAVRLFHGDDGDITPNFEHVTSNVRHLPTPNVHATDDDEIEAALDDAANMRGAAQHRTEELTEPEEP